jgi:SAM-dependent methyltransferase
VTASARPEAAYSFDNDDPAAVDRHQFLARMLDDSTFARLSTVGDLTGGRCLEVGAGGGSVARWLAERAGATGRVVATDLNTRHLPTDEGYTVLQHDLVKDPVPDGPWDLIHARMVLLHIPQRREILSRLAASLAPGGALVIEDWATRFPNLVLAAPSAADAKLIDAYQKALVETILPPRGNDPDWAERAHAVMLEEGLVDVETHIDARSWRGGTPGALIAVANIAQLREEFLDAGFTNAELDRIGELVADPRLVLRSHFMYSTVGRRPAA